MKLPFKFPLIAFDEWLVSHGHPSCIIVHDAWEYYIFSPSREVIGELNKFANGPLHEYEGIDEQDFLKIWAEYTALLPKGWVAETLRIEAEEKARLEAEQSARTSQWNRDRELAKKIATVPLKSGLPRAVPRNLRYSVEKIKEESRECSRPNPGRCSKWGRDFFEVIKDHLLFLPYASPAKGNTLYIERENDIKGRGLSLPLAPIKDLVESSVHPDYVGEEIQKYLMDRI